MTPTVREQGNIVDRDRKFREMIVWVCRHSVDDPLFGATKLNKLLFFMDLEALRRLGRTISKQQYQKLKDGPAPRRLLPTVRELTKAGDLVDREVAVVDFPRHRTFAIRAADLSLFSETELAIMKECLSRYWLMNGRQISRISHDFIGWQVVGEGDTVPLGAVFISDRNLTQDEQEYALTIEAAGSSRLP